jgi:adenylyltransferase and sulfurtransferase
MDRATLSAEALRRQITATEEELKRLKEQLAYVEAKDVQDLKSLSLQDEPGPVTGGRWPLSAEEYKRYGRQMIVPNIGIEGKIPQNSIWSIFG